MIKLTLTKTSCIIFAIALFTTTPFALNAFAKDDILLTGRRLLSEERRQLEVRRRISNIVFQINDLLDDLESNGLTDAGGGKAIRKMNTLLDRLGKINVPAAATSLRQARSEKDKVVFHIQKAEKEIDLIIEELNKIIKGTETALVDEMLLRQIREIIKTEDFLWRQTKTWGIKIITDASAADVDKGRLGRAQQSNIDRFQDFVRTLSQARGDTPDEESRKRYLKAEDSIDSNKPHVSMANAINQIDAKKAIRAVEYQAKALEALREIEKILAADENDIYEAIKELEEIIVDEKELKDEVEQAENRDFREQQSQLEARQLEIQKDLQQFTNTLPEALLNFQPQNQPQDQPQNQPQDQPQNQPQDQP